MPDIDPRKICLTAADWLDLHEHAKNALFRDFYGNRCAHSQADSACAEGAISIAVRQYLQVHGVSLTTPEYMDVCQQARDLVAAAAGINVNVPTWNDYPNTTKDEVVQAFREAAAQ